MPFSLTFLRIFPPSSGIHSPILLDLLILTILLESLPVTNVLTLPPIVPLVVLMTGGICVTPPFEVSADRSASTNSGSTPLTLVSGSSSSLSPPLGSPFTPSFPAILIPSPSSAAPTSVVLLTVLSIVSSTLLDPSPTPSPLILATSGVRILVPSIFTSSNIL